MRSARERWHYNITSPPTGWTHAENDSINMDMYYENHILCCAIQHGTNCWYKFALLPLSLYIYLCKIYSWFSVQVITQSWQMLCPMLSVDIVDITLASFEIIGRADSDQHMRTRSYTCSCQRNCMDYWVITLSNDQTSFTFMLTSYPNFEWFLLYTPIYILTKDDYLWCNKFLWVWQVYNILHIEN